MARLRVLIVDDSAMNRRTLTDLLEEAGVEVVGVASDGDEALRLAASLAPDMITLDLEMPRMDGFTFLRLLMASRPTAVIVVSSHSAKDNVFRALELGAIDFITKPDQLLAGDISSVRAQLEQMVQMVKQLAPANVGKQRRVTPAAPARARPSVPRPKPVGRPEKLVVIASSTGGPTALLELFARFPASTPASVLVAQHMPDRFTRTFADRLDRLSAMRVVEADGIQPIVSGNGFVCPGGRCVEVQGRDGQWLARVVWPTKDDLYAPSADRLFCSAARVAGSSVIGVVLTGMGDDGAKGVQAIKEAGGMVLVESESTAVVYGMPKAAKQTGAVDEVLPLSDLAQRVAELIS